MKHAWFIMKLWQMGNIGPHQIEKLEGQEKDGYNTSELAAEAMKELKKEMNWFLNEKGYSFTVMQLWWN